MLKATPQIREVESICGEHAPGGAFFRGSAAKEKHRSRSFASIFSCCRGLW